MKLVIAQMKYAGLSAVAVTDDLAALTTVGIAPETTSFLVLESRVHWRAGLRSLAHAVVECSGTGVCTSDYGALTFKKLQQPIRPVDAMQAQAGALHDQAGFPPPLRTTLRILCRAMALASEGLQNFARPRALHRMARSVTPQAPLDGGSVPTRSGHRHGVRRWPAQAGELDALPLVRTR